MKSSGIQQYSLYTQDVTLFCIDVPSWGERASDSLTDFTRSPEGRTVAPKHVATWAHSFY